MTTLKLIAAMTLLAPLLGAGCSCNKKTEPAPEAASTTSAASAEPSAIAARTTPPKDATGIAECDEYTKRYEECLNRSKTPLAGAAQAFEAQRKSFRIAAATVEGKAKLGPMCKAMLEKLGTDPICQK